MTPEASLPKLQLGNNISVDITLDLLGEFTRGPSESSKEAAARAGISIQDFRRKTRAAIHASLAERRPALRQMDDWFFPSTSSPVQSPLMNYGCALTGEAMLYCAEKLGLAPSREVRRDGQVIDVISKTNSGYLGRVQNRLRNHLTFLASVPLTGSITVQLSIHPTFLHTFVLFTNYDMAFKRERVRRYKLEGIKAVAEELKKGFEGYEGKIPYLMWHWDTENCGYGYSAPWDEYNLWPAKENRHWARKFMIEDTDDLTTHEQQAPSEARARGRLPRKKSLRAEDDGLNAHAPSPSCGAMTSETPLPKLRLGNDISIDITLDLLGEFTKGPSESSKAVAAKAGIKIQDFRKKTRAAIYSELAERRPAIRKMDDRFFPSASSPIQSPLMNYGCALTDEAMLYCAEKLGLAPSREVRRDGQVIDVISKTNSGYLGRVQNRLRDRLTFLASVSFTGSITVQLSINPKLLYTFVLFTNYDMAFKRERVRRYKLEGIKAIAEELKKGFEGYEGKTPYLMWHWDTENCGYGYSAPWDEFNLWPAKENRYWDRKFTIEDEDDFTTNERRTLPVPHIRGRLPREKSLRAEDDGLHSK
ncbi:unnamed protein product [Peniophora sp. CBMAI 1063]|nr:unnamed protein product [Peniophora sp. CBMAI 1063]